MVLQRRKQARWRRLVLMIGSALLLGALFWASFHVWRLQHPEAPTWTYFLRD